ncbi:hypothetical protein ACFQZI_20395 [Mucilaginibacter lutimaris]|uniref:DNA alkylation repair enzyme n=1 Tax=Mucilaginibacter lutimaris TaxID=931629 RepID=A0ABW2ZLW9_9SPHI
MPVTDNLIKELNADRTKGFIERLAKKLRDENYNINEVLDLTFHNDKKIGFRAAWLLDTLMTGNPELYINNLEYFIKRIPGVKNESCKRHYARILFHLTMPNAPLAVRNSLAAIDMEYVVEKCFDWIIDPKVKVAVKVFAADVLFNLHNRYDWIKDELTNQVQFMMRDGGPAIQSRGKKLLAAIEVKIKKSKFKNQTCRQSRF